MVGRTRLASRTGASATNVTFPSKAGATSRATAMASRVLPTPPGPVSVIRRGVPFESMDTRSARSRSRPINAPDALGSPAGDAPRLVGASIEGASEICLELWPRGSDERGAFGCREPEPIGQHADGFESGISCADRVRNR